MRANYELTVQKGGPDPAEDGSGTEVSYLDLVMRNAVAWLSEALDDTGEQRVEIWLRRLGADTMVTHHLFDPEENPTADLPAEVHELFRTMQALEEPDGSWPGAEVVDALVRWFVKLGFDVDGPPGT